jgi:PDDEXK-like domain of unknown function (DUF3799)
MSSWLDDEEEDYYSKFAISNSSLSTLNPEQGGSPKKFQEFFSKNKEKKQSLSLERGSLIHLYCENPSGFVVDDIEKPSENICKIIEHVWTKQKDVILPDSEEEAIKMIEEAILEKAKEIGYGQAWKPETIVEKVSTQGKGYLEFLKSSNGKQVMSAETKKIVESCTQSLHTHSLAQELLFDEHSRIGLHYYNELPVYWTESVPMLDSDEFVDVPCKAKLDRLVVDHGNKIIYHPDLKTTSKGAYKFQGSFESYRYYRQHAFYKRALQIFLVNEFPATDFTDWEVKAYNIVVETCDDPQTVVYSVPESWIKKGEQEYKALLQRYVFHSVTNGWEYSMEEYLSGGVLILKDPEEITKSLED